MMFDDGQMSTFSGRTYTFLETLLMGLNLTKANLEKGENTSSSSKTVRKKRIVIALESDIPQHALRVAHACG